MKVYQIIEYDASIDSIEARRWFVYDFFSKKEISAEAVQEVLNNDSKKTAFDSWIEQSGMDPVKTSLAIRHYKMKYAVR